MKTTIIIAAAAAAFGPVLTFTPSWAHASGIDGLRAHRAVYDLALRKASDRSGITGMSGRIVYEVTGSKCDGFSTRFRFFTRVQTPSKSFTNDQRTTSFESADGKTYTFVQKSYLNGQLEQELRGTAERQPTATLVELTKPTEEEVKLEPSIFMTQHIAKLIEAAHSDQTFLNAKVYDGSDQGDEVMETLAVIGKRKDSLDGLEGESKETSKLFRGEAAWPVSVSYFSTKNVEGAGEKLPLYQVSFIMHESGVSRELKMDYSDYSLKGDLKKIEYLNSGKCE